MLLTSPSWRMSRTEPPSYHHHAWLLALRGVARGDREPSLLGHPCKRKQGERTFAVGVGRRGGVAKTA